MKRMIQRVLASLGLAASSCAVRPGVPLRSVSFHESPHIILRGNEYFLRYRIAAPKQAPFLMRRLVYARKTPERAFYYFSVPTSNAFERDTLVERPLAPDGFTDYARRDAVYWLDPDGTETHIPLRQ